MQFRIRLTAGILAASLTFSYASTSLGARPVSSSEWQVHESRIRAAEIRGDFVAAERASLNLLVHCRNALTEAHPDVAMAAAAVRQYHTLQTIDEEARQQYVMVAESRFRTWQGIRTLATQVLPNAGSALEILASFHAASNAIPESMPPEASLCADCDFGIVRVLGFVHAVSTAEPFADRAHDHCLSVAGLDTPAKRIEFALAEILREREASPTTQFALLRSILDFAERHQTTDRLIWWKERSTTLLAEAHYRQNNHAEADRLYAEVRNRLPDKIDHELAGWCKSWCDRHEARQLMEKGDWEDAYAKIVQARVGTIEYGHYNLNKGLTMERIVRMSAEIQRHRGNDKEADEDLEYAQMIADHAARLRTVLEAETKTWSEDEEKAASEAAK